MVPVFDMARIGNTPWTESMHKLCSSSAARRLAKIFSRSSARFKSTDGRPSAPLGSRILTDPEDIFKHNMWDHVQWTEEEKENARQKAQENSFVKIPLADQAKFDTDAHQYWDNFYEIHQDKFFKDRKWLFLEFPELLPSNAENQTTNRCLGDQQLAYPAPVGSSTDAETILRQDSGVTPHHRSTDTLDHQSRQGVALERDEAPYPGQHASFKIFEVGCGVGNSVFPIINSLKETDAFLYCCDFSTRAIQMVKTHPDYSDSVCHAFVHDLREEMTSFPFPPHSLDVIMAVFVLSAIHPSWIQGVVNRLSTYLKYGGVFLFRDYGRYDFSQLRFKKGQCLSDHFYTRGNGTCVYFFTQEDVHSIFSNAGLEEVQNLEDKRLQVNRRKRIVIPRVWMQSKYRKVKPPS